MDFNHGRRSKGSLSTAQKFMIAVNTAVERYSLFDINFMCCVMC